MEQDFIIIKVSWETQRKRNYDTSEENLLTYSYYSSLINFLQNNKLTTRQLLKEGQVVDDEICIKKSDLTEEGFLIFKGKYFDKWVNAIFDKKRSPLDIKPLEKALVKIRSRV